MADHPNAARAREIFDAMNSGDASVSDALAEDVKWHVIGSDEPIVGKEAVLSSFQGMSDAGFEFTAELHDVVGNDDHVIALMTARVTKDGKTFEYRTAEIAHMRDGKITERWAFAEDTEAINRFFGS
jgi:ketosteroid isomerase-like protein